MWSIKRRIHSYICYSFILRFSSGRSAHEMKVLLLFVLFAGARAGYFTLPAVAVRNPPTQTQEPAGENGNIYYNDNSGQHRTSAGSNGIQATSYSSSGPAGTALLFNSASHSQVPAVPAGPSNTVANTAAPTATYPLSSGPSQVYAAPAVPTVRTPVSAAPSYAGSYAASDVYSYPDPPQVQNFYRQTGTAQTQGLYTQPPPPQVQGLYGQGFTTAAAPQQAAFPVNGGLRYTAISAGSPGHSSVPQFFSFANGVSPATYSTAPSPFQAAGQTFVHVPLGYAPSPVSATYSTRVPHGPSQQAAFPVNGGLRYTPVPAAPPGYTFAPSTPQFSGFTSAASPAAYSAVPSSVQHVGPASYAPVVSVPASHAPASVSTTYSTRVEPPRIYNVPVVRRYVFAPFRSQTAPGATYSSSTADALEAGVPGQATATQNYGPPRICPLAFGYVSSLPNRQYGGGYGRHVKYLF